MSDHRTPPYIDLHERGSYDTDELDALEAATRPEVTVHAVVEMPDEEEPGQVLEIKVEPDDAA